jgi:hypothetical protein
MKTRVSNSGGSSALEASSASTAASTQSNGLAPSTTNGRRSRLASVDQVYVANSNNNPLSPRTRSSTIKTEIDEEVSFVDPLSTVDMECNGLENGHASDDALAEDPIAVHDESNILKKKRKSSAEKFLEDNSDYYGFQVLPSKLRSSSSSLEVSDPALACSSATSFVSDPFLELNHEATTAAAPECRDQDNVVGLGAGIVSSKNTGTIIPYFYTYDNAQ